MPLSQFARPLLIYDDKCYSCTQFARVASALSRGWIRTAGHYYSQEAREAKAAVFPQGYDPTNMFWLINSRGAFGARSGLPRVAGEIVTGWFRADRKNNNDALAPVCAYDGTSMSCYTPANVFRRIARMLSHGAAFTFK